MGKLLHCYAKVLLHNVDWIDSERTITNQYFAWTGMGDWSWLDFKLGLDSGNICYSIHDETRGVELGY